MCILNLMKSCLITPECLHQFTPTGGSWAEQFNLQIHGSGWQASITGVGSGCLQPRLKVSFTSVSSVQSLSHVQFFVTPRIAACQASLSITNSRSLLKLMPIESVMSSNHLILCHLLLLLPPIPPSIRVFSNESTLRMRWPKY